MRLEVTGLVVEWFDGCVDRRLCLIVLVVVVVDDWKSPYQRELRFLYTTSIIAHLLIVK